MAKQESESWSDDSESDEISMSMSNFSSRNSDVTSDDFMDHHDHDHDHDHDHHTVDHFGHLYCQYNETSSPHDRIPLTEKVHFNFLISTPLLIKYMPTYVVYTSSADQ